MEPGLTPVGFTPCVNTAHELGLILDLGLVVVQDMFQELLLYKACLQRNDVI